MYWLIPSSVCLKMNKTNCWPITCLMLKRFGCQTPRRKCRIVVILSTCRSCTWRWRAVRQRTSANQAVVAATPHRHWRQLALIDAAGRTAVYSGANVRAERGEAQGRDCASIANIVRSAALPQAMVSAFEASPERPLACRLLDALAAGEAAGGEYQPVTSAALIVVDRESFPYADLRVDDHEQPIAELARLWSKIRAGGPRLRDPRRRSGSRRAATRDETHADMIM